MSEHAQFWTEPHRLGHRRYPSVLHFLPSGSGGMSVRRIISALVGSEYAYHGQLDEFWLNGDIGCANTERWVWKPDGNYYLVSISAPLEAWFRRRGHDLNRLRLILTIRDPRDSIVSLYHLTHDTLHSKYTAGTPVQSAYEAEQRRVAELTLDEYVRERFVYQLENLRTVRALAEQLHPAQRCVLSYAQLCEDFPRFLARLIDFLRIDPDPAVVTHLLQTEDVRNKDSLNSGSFAHCPKAAPMPGRHVRELPPDTVQLITRLGADVLDWLEQLERGQPEGRPRQEIG